MVDLWGPAAFGAAQAASVRPTYSPSNGGGDPESWYQDCTSPASDDGTEWRSAALNILLAAMRASVRKSGVAVSNLDDNLLARAIRSQGLNYVPTIGGTANALTATLDPAPADWAALTGTPFRFVVGTTNTGAATLNLNGLGAKDIVYPGDNSPMLAGELIVGAVRTGLYDGTRVQLIDAGSRARAGVSFRGMRLITSTQSWDPSTDGLTIRDRILIFCWGAGGGGSSVNGTWGAAGGGGGLGIKSADCPASPVTVTVGTGGAGTNAGGTGGTGGTTSFGAIVSATGGSGGTSGPGGGGNGSGGDVNMPGSNGGDIINDVVAFANGGAAPFMGGSVVGAPAANSPIGSGGWARSNGPDASSGANGAVLAIY